MCLPCRPDTCSECSTTEHDLPDVQCHCCCDRPGTEPKCHPSTVGLQPVRLRRQRRRQQRVPCKCHLNFCWLLAARNHWEPEKSLIAWGPQVLVLSLWCCTGWILEPGFLLPPVTGETRHVTQPCSGGSWSKEPTGLASKECGRVERGDPAVRAHNLLIVPLNWQRELPVEEISWESMR